MDLMVLGLGMALGAALLTGTVLRRTLVVVTVRGGSMEPTYRDGERVLVRRGGRCAVGQVVVVRQEDDGLPSPAPRQAVAATGTGTAEQWMIKRVAAVAGDRPPPGALPEPYATAGGSVPPGALILLGDNTHNSYDSREAGYFPTTHVLGTVLGPRPRPPYDEDATATGMPGCAYEELLASGTVSDSVYVGNAGKDAALDRGWLLGHFKDAGDPRHSEAVEIKWGVHPRGDERAEWVRGEERTALLVLISGRFRVELPGRDVLLEEQGDYVVWGHGVDHSWFAEEESVVLTVRWPSVPGYAVEESRER